MLKNLKMIPCCVTPAQHAALKALSKRAGVSMQQYLREAVADVLGKHDGSTPPAGDTGYITAHDLAAAQKVFDSRNDPIIGSCAGQSEPCTRQGFKRLYAHIVGPDALIAAQNEPGMTPECARAYAIYSKLHEAWEAGVKWAGEAGTCSVAAPKSPKVKCPKAGYITEAAKADRARRAELEAEFARANDRLQASYHEYVSKEVAKRLPTEAQREIERARSQVEHAQELERIWRHRAARALDSMRLFIDNWRTLIGCLHPDRAEHSSDDRRARMAKAADIVTRTKNLIEETDYKKW
jgi:hypothetical protein